MELSGKEKRKLRALANPLKPALKIGKEGISENSIKALKEIFETKELIKVEITRSAPVETKEAAEHLATASASEVVGIIGRKIILFKRNEEDPKIHI